jgi:hypothetical protein
MEKFNDRVDFLWQILGYKSARAFDRALGIPEKQTASITGIRQTLPKVDYVQKIIEVHPEVNTNWLLGGGGEWKNPPKGYIEELQTKIETLLKDLEESTKKQNEVLEENTVFRNSIVNMAVKSNFGGVVNFRFASTGMPVCKIIRVNFTGFTRSCTRMMS